ncbi:hypothetical protein ACFOQM_13705 [Paenibacillus sp. GCM10012307]
MFVALIIIGFLMVTLSGFEKIIIYLNFADRVGDIAALKNVVPDYIWLITNLTFFCGVVLIVAGLGFYIASPKNKK